MPDYPYTTVSARAGESLINVTIGVASESMDVTAESIAALVSSHLATLPGVTVTRTTLREITETVT